ncbi:F0F1 ATP synthase subunit gamma [bacterium]|nr:F0F1 ATP synthase subunit gamma [bacterium]
MSQKLIDLKNRMRSVENIKGTTETMSTVSAAKLARARYKAATLGIFAERMRQIALIQSELALFSEKDMFSEEVLNQVSPLLVKKVNKNRIVMFVIASDIGMCGNYNGRIGKTAQGFLDGIIRKNKKAEVGVWIKGIRGERFFKRNTPFPILKVEPWSDQGVSISDALSLIMTMTDLFLHRNIDEIYCAYTKFLSPVKRQPTVIKLLPFSFGIEEETKKGKTAITKWIYEPDSLTILKELIPMYFKIQIFDILLESYASEQGARMMAMEDASDRASEKLHEMGIQYNRMRRDLITLDLLGILSAARVIEKESASQTAF